MDLFLIAPELALTVAACVVLLSDLLVQRKGWLAGLSGVGIGVAAALSLALLLQGVQSTTFSGMLVLDPFSLFFKFLFLGIAFLIVLSSTEYLGASSRHQGEYYALVLLSTAGMMLMAATRELISIYIALELVGVSLYILAAFLKDDRSSEAGLKYLVLGGISSAVLLYGMALVYGLSGTTDLAGIAQGVPRLGGTNYPALLLGIIFMVAGFGFKLAAVPFQMWVPDVYQGAPTPVTAYLSVASKAAGFAVVLRVFYEAFGHQSLDWALIFGVISAVSMTLGNVVAIVQDDIKRMLGYSSIAQAGYMLMGLASISAGELGASGLIFFLTSYAFTNLGAFIAIIAISNRIRSDEIPDYAGMARRAPLLALGLTFSLLSLTGIPPTSGFIAKIYLFNAAVQSGLVWLVVLAVINTVISAYYYLRVVKEMYLREPSALERVPASGPLGVALALAAAGVLFLGVVPAPLIAAAEAAARTFFG